MRNSGEVGGGPERRDRIQQTTAVTDRRNAEILQVLRRQTRQQITGDGILLECRLILAKIKRAQPVGNFHCTLKGFTSHDPQVSLIRDGSVQETDHHG